MPGFQNLRVRHSVDSRLKPPPGNSLPKRCCSALHQRQGWVKHSKPLYNNLIKPKNGPTYPRSAKLQGTLLKTVVSLQKEKTLFGAKLQQIQRIASVLQEYSTLPMGMGMGLIRVVVDKQVSKVFPQVGRLVKSVMNTAQSQSAHDEHVLNFILNDIGQLQERLNELKSQQGRMKDKTQKQARMKSNCVQLLRQVVERQDGEILDLQRQGRCFQVGYPDLETKHKLSNMRYK